MSFAAAIIIAAAASATLLIRSSWERRQLKIERYTIENEHIPEKGMRIAFISDIHDRLTKDGTAQIEEAVRSEKAELCILGGDIITLNGNRAGLYGGELVCELIKKLKAVGPVFYAEGNHEQRARLKFPSEYEVFAEECKKAGAAVLSDGRMNYGELSIYCAALEPEYYKKFLPGFGKKKIMPENYLSEKLGSPSPDKMNILLMHSPLYLKEAQEWGADLVLSGHLHGGTIRLPVIGGIMTPQYQFFVNECAGQHKRKNCTMIVSRGIGTHSIKLRLNNLPELSIIELKKKKAGKNQLAEKAEDIE